MQSSLRLNANQVMEGERILSVLKKRSESFESVSKDVKVVHITTSYLVRLPSVRVGTFSIPTHRHTSLLC